MNKRMILLGLVASLLTSPALAQEPVLDDDFTLCLQKIDEHPRKGRQYALRWISDGGGDPAVYCTAMADLAIGKPRIAAARLEGLADKNRPIDNYLSAKLYVEAAKSWVAGREDEKALAAATEALSMAAESSEVRLLLAPLYAAMEKWGLVKRMLDEAERDGPLSAAALILRAKAKVNLSDHTNAAVDLQNGLNLDPQNIDGLVLRGEMIGLGYRIDVQ